MIPWQTHGLRQLGCGAWGARRECYVLITLVGMGMDDYEGFDRGLGKKVRLGTLMVTCMLLVLTHKEVSGPYEVWVGVL